MINKFKNKLEEIQNKPEKTKIKIIWISVIFCMTIFAIGFFNGLDLRKNTQHDFDGSIFSSFPDLKNEFNDIDNMNKKYKATTDEVIAEVEKREIEEIVENYIENNDYFENGSISDLKLKNIEKLKDSWFIEYEQFYKDILIYESSVSFVVDDTERKVISSNSNFDSNIEIKNIEPIITEDEAYNLITIDLDNVDLDLENTEIVIYKNNNKNSVEYYLAWKMDIFSSQSAQKYVYFINAENGKIISIL